MSRGLLSYRLSAALLVCVSACSNDEPAGPSEEKPRIEITAPANAAPVYGDILVQVRVTATRPVARVALLVDGLPSPLRVLLAGPYVFQWTTPDEPDSTIHTLQASAVLNDSTVLTSQAVTVVCYRLAPGNLRLVA